MKGLARGPHVRAARWLLAAVLLLAAGWCLNLMLFNWWAAGGPPTPHRELYEHRGNVFCAATAVLFAGFVSVVVMNLCRSKRQT